MTSGSPRKIWRDTLNLIRSYDVSWKLAYDPINILCSTSLNLLWIFIKGYGQLKFTCGTLPVKNSEDRVAKLNKEGSHSHIQAWEESKKTKVFNRYNRKLSKILAWENMKKATAEARLRKGEEKLEKRRAEYVEQIRNEMAYAHKKGDEKRAKAEVNKGVAGLVAPLPLIQWANDDSKERCRALAWRGWKAV
ncbi:hypothetical protein SUGI_0261640 [Cryptomeria japonica]|nr:hypothetical protein SUGI_0261640 [Cryptomeria japonica]